MSVTAAPDVSKTLKVKSKQQNKFRSFFFRLVLSQIQIFEAAALLEFSRPVEPFTLEAISRSLILICHQQR